MSSAPANLPVLDLPAARAGANRTVALVGPPNSGKSTLFNRLTGLRQKVANYPGVTVEKRLGRAKLSGQDVLLVDLPGVYSLYPRTEDEQVTHDVLRGEMDDVPKPDAVILIVDVTNLGRQLTLAAPILSLGLPTLVLLNMADDLRRGGGKVDVNALAEQVGTPVALASARTGEGLPAVEEFLEGAFGLPKPVQLPIISNVPECRQWSAELGERAGYRAPLPSSWTRRLDALFLHPVAGPLIFAVVVIAVFQTIFLAAVPLMDGVEAMISMSGGWIQSILPESWFRSLLIEGIWGGVGSVIVFLPQILLLFIFIGVLEDSGYMARAALIADRTMAKVGLQGKSFIPLISAYACAIPAIMSTRSHGDDTDRPVHDLLGTFAGLYAGDRGVHTSAGDSGQVSGRESGHDDRPLCPGICGRDLHGGGVEVFGAQERADAVHARNAPLPHADVTVYWTAIVRPREDLPAAGRHGHYGHDSHSVASRERATAERRAAGNL